jgi:hypothetical protein
MHPIVEQKIAAGHCICGRGLSVDPRCPIHKNEATDNERRRHGLPPNLGCKLPPSGWWCSREPGHEGPCAARPSGVSVPSTKASDEAQHD